MAVVLLVGAGLMVRSTQRLFSQPLGFTPDGVVVLQIHGTSLESGDANVHRFFDQALEAAKDVPGVADVAMATQVPLNGDQEIDRYGVGVADGTGDGELWGAYRYAVTPGYLETMGIRVTRGRSLSRDDVAGAPPVAVVSESLARRLFGDGDPLGRPIQVGAAGPAPYTVVGVVADVKQGSLASNANETVYVTPHQWHWADRVRWIVARVQGDPASRIAALQRAVWSVDPNQPVIRAQTLDRLVTRSESRRRFVLVVIAAFALAALTLSVVGLYGVVAGRVAERLPELGVRAALGASSDRIVALVVRQGMALAAVGVGLGVGGALLATRLLTSLLFGVSRLDPVTYLGVVGVLLAGAALACVLPAMRAARVDPVRTLKAE